MGTRVKMLNEYHMKALLERGTVDFNKFYKDELIDFIEVARKQIKELEHKLQKKENIIKNIKSQLDYLETYSSEKDVFEDMKRRLDRIGSIIGDDKE